MQFNIQSTGQLSTQYGVKFCVYGQPKVGKTRLIATLPNPIIISTERGLLSLRQYNLPFIEVTNFQQFEEASNWLLHSHEARQFTSVAVDSVSDIAEILLTEEKRRNKGSNNGFKPYAELLDKVMSRIRVFRDVPYKHVYFVAKQERDKDEHGMTLNMPSMPGKELTRQLPYFLDEIFQLCVFRDPQTGQSQSWLRTRPDSQNVAGDRSGALDEWEPPHLGRLIEKIMAT